MKRSTTFFTSKLNLVWLRFVGNCFDFCSGQANVDEQTAVSTAEASHSQA